MTFDLFLEIIGTIVGLIYLWLEYRANIYLWIVGIIMPAIYIFIYYRAGLYADFGINIYYLIAGIYGFVVWNVKKRSTNKQNLNISHIPTKVAILSVLTIACLYAIIYYLLTTYTDSNVVAMDSFTTAVSVVAMWMLSRKYIEQWLAWSLVNIVSFRLYLHKGLCFTAILYFIYFVATILGYLKWKRMMSKQ